MSLLEINYYYQKPTTCETQGQPINIPCSILCPHYEYRIRIDRCLNDFENQYSKTRNGVSYSYTYSILIQ